MSETPRLYSKQEVRLTLSAIMVVFLLSSMDQTIVSTAMPRIIEELHGLERFTWVTTAYMLASTVMVPIYGKLGDLFGRKPVLVWGISVFLFGSALCGISGETATLPLIGDGMNQLILFRAIQGIGGAALFTTAFATIADLLPPTERARIGGLFGSVFGLSSVLGPLVGGFLTDHGTVAAFGGTVEGWRWCFYVNLPLGFLALFVVAAKMPRFGGHDPGRIDFAGAALIALTCVPLLLALTWGGHQYPWGDPVIVSLFVGSVAALLMLLLVERLVPHPIVPLDLFANKTFARANLAGFLLGVAFFGTIMFLPLYLQVVQGVPATNSGLTLLPLMLGMIGSSIIAGRVAAKMGRYKPLMIGGSVSLLAAIGWLCTLDLDTPSWAVSLRMVVVGLGLGPAQSLYSLTIQNAVPLKRMGVATSSAQFFRQIGSTIGIAVFGALMTNHLAADLPQRAPAFAQYAAANGGHAGGELSQAQTAVMNPERIQAEIEKRLPPDADAATRERAHAAAASTVHALKESFLVSIIRMFQDSAVIILLGALVTLTIPELPLRKWGARPPESAPATAE